MAIAYQRNGINLSLPRQKIDYTDGMAMHQYTNILSVRGK
jgi:hypothetical protein